MSDSTVVRSEAVLGFAALDLIIGATDTYNGSIKANGKEMEGHRGGRIVLYSPLIMFITLCHGLLALFTMLREVDIKPILSVSISSSQEVVRSAEEKHDTSICTGERNL